MKKRWILLFAAMILVIGIGVGIYIWEQENSGSGCERVDEILATLDPEKITACVVDYMIYPTDDHYEETDPEKVKAMYEALLHMKVKGKEFDPATYNRGLLYTISFIQGGEEISLFLCRSKAYSVYIELGGEKEHYLKVTNYWQLNWKYSWRELLDEMTTQAEEVIESES